MPVQVDNAFHRFTSASEGCILNATAETMGFEGEPSRLFQFATLELSNRRLLGSVPMAPGLQLHRQIGGYIVMRIAQIAPLFESVPPQKYGGTERVVSYLTEELVRLGHEVTLFASADSGTRAKLVPCAPAALRTDPKVQDGLATTILMLEEVYARKSEFDLLHFHIDYLHYPASRRENIPHVTTLHGRLNIPELQNVYRKYWDMPVISISNSQRRPLPEANWVGTVHHGLPVNLYEPGVESEEYLVFVGRISPEKGPERAVEIAIRSGYRLKIAAKVDRQDQEYFDRALRPRLDHPLIEFLGEINDKEKNELMRRAKALLFPIDWDEPFGLVTIEAMACGTPVIAWNRGSVPEVLTDGRNGFLIQSIEEGVQAVKKIDQIDRTACRQEFENRFTDRRMAQDYCAIYEQLLA